MFESLLLYYYTQVRNWKTGMSQNHALMELAGSVFAPLRVSPSGSVGAKRCPLGPVLGTTP